jgi:hypothetical protein
LPGDSKGLSFTGVLKNIQIHAVLDVVPKKQEGFSTIRQIWQNMKIKNKGNQENNCVR